MGNPEMERLMCGMDLELGSRKKDSWEEWYTRDTDGSQASKLPSLLTTVSSEHRRVCRLTGGGQWVCAVWMNEQGRLSRAHRKSHTVVIQELWLMCELKMTPYADQGDSSEGTLSSHSVFLRMWRRPCLDSSNPYSTDLTTGIIVFPRNNRT